MQFVPYDLNLDFMGRKKVFIGVSLVLLLASVVSLTSQVEASRTRLAVSFFARQRMASAALVRAMSVKRRISGVVRTALENAASVGSLVLTTEALVAEKPEEDKGPAGPPGGGYDDM